MKKVFILFICLLLVSCAEKSLSDIVTQAVAAEETLPAGSILCYGRMHENSISFDTLSDYLGLAGYPEFAEKIEELVVYSALTGDYCELAVMRLYSASDNADASLFLERRITEAKRALSAMGKTGHAGTAYVEAHGNTVALFMLPDNEAIKKLVF